MHARGSLALCLAFALALFACGNDGSSSTDPDARPPDAPPFELCGNLIIEGGETCDDGNEDPDDGCSAMCQLECGDGQVTGGETCDTAIAAGETGACATEATCTDDDACTTAILTGTGCEVVCDFAPITAPIDGDGCCPSGQDATTDNDCTAVCGNGVVEAGETCDTAISGPGACPTACDDGDFCTTDALNNQGTCVAACSATPITVIGPDDGCCPPSADPNTDPDCLTSCGDGVVSGVETCDTAIPGGNPGACPASCNDGDVCTTDALVNAGTCLDACTAAPIGPGPVDGCCPTGSDLGDDPDCPAACGDGVITAPEACDDGNTTSGDGCSATCTHETVAFRFTDLDLRDPHVFATLPLLGCTDVTDFTSLFGNGVNPQLQTNIQTDEDGDGLLDLSIANTFTPLLQTGGTMTMSDLVWPDCTAPMSSTQCTLPAGSPHTTATAVNMAGPTTCLEPVSQTTSGYSPPVNSTDVLAGSTCYVANAGTVTVTLAGIPITLEDARIAGEWFGTPASQISNGLIRGFISETAANATIIPEGTTGFDSIDGEPLSSLLKGGVGNCEVASPALGDKDTLNGVSGWYFYLNFSATRVPYTEL